MNVEDVNDEAKCREAVIGDRVAMRPNADVKFEGAIVGIFIKARSGRMRYVVESDDGAEMTFDSPQIYIVHRLGVMCCG